MPRRKGLSGVSRTPLWALVLALQVVLLGGIAALLITVGDSVSVWVFVGAWGVTALLMALLVHFVAGRRLMSLAIMMQQDPQVIAGDPACLIKLKSFPWYGVREVDAIQLAVAETYNAYAIDARRAGKAGGVSHAGGGGGGGGDDDLADLEWQSAVSFDDNNDTLAAYLLENERTPRAAAAMVRRIFTPRASRGNTPRRSSTTSSAARLVTDSPAPPGVEYADGGFGSASYRSCVSTSSGTRGNGGDSGSGSSAVNVGGSHGGETEGTALLTYRRDRAGSYSATSTNGGAAAGGWSSGAPPTRWDPLGDNNAGWDVLRRGLKDPGNSLLLQLLSQVKVGSSLSAVTLPVHILESRSLLEKLSDMFVSWYLLVPLARREIRDPYDKLEQVFRWFISAYRMKPEGAKKPFNPILGEAFRCTFDNPHDREAGQQHSGRLQYIAEQVSHHPPVTGIFAECEGVCELQGIYFPKSKLVSLNCAASLGEGCMVLHITPTDERFKITFPSAYVSGITVGTPRLELGGTVTITDLSMKACVRVDFLRKGFFSGKYDELKASVLSPEGEGTGREFYGTWFDVIMKRGVDGHPDTIFHDPKSCTAVRPHALEIAGHPKQSRVVWRDLTQHLRDSDAASAAAAKHEVETVQRQERKAMAAESRVHETTFFKFGGGRPIKDARHEDLQDVGQWRFVGHEVLKAP